MSTSASFRRNPLETLSLDDDFSDDAMMFDDIFDDVDADAEVEVEVDLDVDELEEELAPTRKKKRRSAKAKAPKKVHLICGLVDRARFATPKGYEKAWKALSEAVDAEQAIPYTPRAQLTFDAVIMHSKFGLGVVADMLSERKAEIVFADQLRRMVCNI